MSRKQINDYKQPSKDLNHLKTASEWKRTPSQNWPKNQNGNRIDEF